LACPCSTVLETVRSCCGADCLAARSSFDCIMTPWHGASDLRGFVGWYSVVGAVLERPSAAPQTLLRQPRIILGVFVAMSCNMSVGWSVGICW
jgi:hypothetical protein